MLDASKAFIGINHWKLFKVLNDGKCPAYVIKVLVYHEQRLCVKWDGMTSDTFPVCNGIKTRDTISQIIQYICGCFKSTAEQSHGWMLYEW